MDPTSSKQGLRWWGVGGPSKRSRDRLVTACGSGVNRALLCACSPTDLSELLKEGTKESHDRAENTQFVKDFLKGRIKKELFKVGAAVLPWQGSSLTHAVADAGSEAEHHSHLWRVVGGMTR